MRYRTFGGTGLRVSELFLGAITFGERGGAGAPIDECRRILDAYAESAAGFDIGFPSALIGEASNWVFGAAQAS